VEINVNVSEILDDGVGVILAPFVHNNGECPKIRVSEVGSNVLYVRSHRLGNPIRFPSVGVVEEGGRADLVEIGVRRLVTVDFWSM
jgi:hypothetical protein